jgi:hypothetical protein
MKLIQILLPLEKSNGALTTEEEFSRIKKDLTDKFGGLTVYNRSPATGLWKKDEVKTVKDDIVIYEVMIDEFDKEWWAAYRKKLERVFRQDQIVARATEIEIL